MSVSGVRGTPRTLQTLTGQGAATVNGSAFEISAVGDPTGVVFGVIGDETAGGGGDLTVTIQDSFDGVTWTDLVVLTALSTDGASHGSPDRAIARFIRASSTVAAGGDTWDATVQVTGDIEFTT